MFASHKLSWQDCGIAGLLRKLKETGMNKGEPA